MSLIGVCVLMLYSTTLWVWLVESACSMLKQQPALVHHTVHGHSVTTFKVLECGSSFG